MGKARVSNRFAGVFVAGAALLGCGPSSEPEATDGAAFDDGASREGSTDAGLPRQVDAIADGEVVDSEAGAIIRVDSGVDSSLDSGSDSGVDSSLDSGSDSGVDSSFDSSEGGEVDSGPRPADGAVPLDAPIQLDAADASGPPGVCPVECDAAADASSPDGESDAGSGVNAAPGTLCAGCGPGQKVCTGSGAIAIGSACVSSTSIFYGCGSASCDPCPTRAHSQAGCGADGGCGVATCEPGWADCNNDPTDGCEADLTSPTSCGACASACGGATPLCGTTGCTAACTGNESLCTDRCVDLQSSASHCGACGTACAASGGAFPACSAGSCTETCPPGFAPCGSGTAAYCADLQGDEQNCGGCRLACLAPSSVAAYAYEYPAYQQCVAGTCTGGCQGGWTACNGICVTTQTDPKNCGACGATCPTGDVCVQSACVPSSSEWLVTGLTNPNEIAVDDTRVFWLDPTAGTVNAVPKQGGAVTTLAVNQASPHVLAIDSAYVYWSVGSGPVTVLRALKDGASPPAVVAGPGALTFAGIGGDSVYTTSNETTFDLNTVQETPKAGGPTTTVTLDLVGLVVVAADDSGLYGRRFGDVPIYYIDPMTGATFSFSSRVDATSFGPFLTGGQFCQGEGHTDSTHIPTDVECRPEVGQNGERDFWYLYPGYDFYGDHGIAYKGPPPSSVAANQCGGYWVAGGIGMGVNSEEFGLWLDKTAQARAVAADETFVYWTDSRGAIGRLPIPTTTASTKRTP